MKILVVHFTDDNFGDMLIEHCFSQLVRVVLKNLNIEEKDYEIKAMGLKNHDERLIADSDLICFAGGGIFGLSYLNLFEHLDAIISTADKNNIPVVFSSIGVNNMDATDENEHSLSDLLKLDCIKAVSVRENPQLFRNYLGDESHDIIQVCDPAVWTGYVYNDELKNILENKNNRDKKIIGINVVRGGLFSDNGINWTLGQEAEFLYNIREQLLSSGYECKFYTNGSTLDNNTMLYFRSKYGISEDELVFVDSTRELVRTVADFDAVVAIRLHSAILCYSLNVPFLNLVWNEKIKLFYNAINRSGYAIELENFTTEKVMSSIKELLENNCSADHTYMMSLYKYLYNTLSEITGNKNKTPIYDFSEVAAELTAIKIPESKDFLDMKTKLYKGQKRYYGQFMNARKKDSLLKGADEKLDGLKKVSEKQSQEISRQKAELDKLNSELLKTKDELKKSQDKLEISVQKYEKLKSDAAELEKQFLVRLYRKTEKIKSQFKK